MGPRWFPIALAALAFALALGACNLVSGLGDFRVTDAPIPSGGGGAAATGTSGGDGGNSDGGVACTSPSMCPGVDGECQTRTCENGVCGFSYRPSGNATQSQVTGDCKRIVCDGMGALV